MDRRMSDVAVVVVAPRVIQGAGTAGARRRRPTEEGGDRGWEGRRMWPGQKKKQRTKAVGDWPTRQGGLVASRVGSAPMTSYRGDGWRAGVGSGAVNVVVVVVSHGDETGWDRMGWTKGR